MTDATASATSKSVATPTTGDTIRPQEAAHFGALAADWWDPAGSSAMLHRLNPVRLRFIRNAVDTHWAGDIRNPAPLAGRTALDVGCGAGLLCEPLARLGARVTGLDAAGPNIAAARAHAAGAGLDITYRQGELGAAPAGQYDLVTCLEVLEHVADKALFLARLGERLAPGGLMIVSTPNRTPTSRLLLTGLAEATGAIPRGTHQWDDFVTPSELGDMLSAIGLQVCERQGIAWRPDRGLHLSGDESLNYILNARHA